MKFHLVFLKAAFKEREWRTFFALLYMTPFCFVGWFLWVVLFPQKKKG